MKLRTYQLEAVDSVIQQIKSKEMSLFAVLMATGSGKSYVIASILYETLYNQFSRKILVCVPTVAVENQLFESLNEFRVNNLPLSNIFTVEVISKLNKEALTDAGDNSINLCTIQRVRQQSEITKHYDLVVLFETPQSTTTLWCYLRHRLI